MRLSYANASTYIIVQESEIMDAWAQALEDHDRKDVTNVDEDIRIDDEESELDR